MREERRGTTFLLVGKTPHEREQSMTDPYVQGQLFYTEEEVITKINNSVQTALYNTISNADRDLAVQRAKDNTSYRIAADSLTVLRECVDNEIINREQGTEVYNALANAHGWDTISSLTRKFTVEVTYTGMSVAEFTDIEAEDEDSATSEVSENMEVEASIDFNISYNNQSANASVDIDQWDISDNFEFTAYEVE